MTKSLFSLSTLTLLFLALIVSPGWAAKPSSVSAKPAPKIFLPRYFFTIDLDPQYQIVGTGELTEEDAAKANCYRFAYDQDGKLKQIAYRCAGVPVPDPLFGAATVDFEYQPGIERRWYRDAKHESVNNIVGIAGEELTLNPAGFPTDIANLDASGTPKRDSFNVIHYVRTLDKDNRLISAQRIGLLGTAITDNNGSFETRTVYNDQGRVCERSNHDSSGDLLNDNEGVALIRTSYTIYPDSTQIVESYFDAYGLAVEEKESSAHEVQRVIDKRGLLLSQSYFDITGAPCLDNKSGIHEIRYEYDDFGNKLSESFFDVDGKPKNQKDSGFARKAYKYDDKNRVVEISFFGDDGAPQVLLNLGAAIIRQEYDDQGNIVRRQFFDGQGHPSLHVQYGAPAIRIKVEGDTTIITLRDAKDEPTKNPINGFSAFSYKTDTDKPLTVHNQYFDRHGHPMSLLRVQIINPHLHALKTTPVMQISARYGAGAVGLGSLLACLLALRKSSHTKRRKVYVPTPLERFLGWFSVLAIFEGTLRFFLTIYWAEVGYLNGRMGPGVYILEAIFIVFFLYRLFRLRVTMRVLNIEKADIHRLVRDFFAKANLKPEWIEARSAYITPCFDVRVNFFQVKYHSYLAFHRRGREGCDLARGLAQYIRVHAGDIQAPLRSRALACYYPCVALCYFLLSCTAFYTLWQLIKKY